MENNHKDQGEASATVRDVLASLDVLFEKHVSAILLETLAFHKEERESLLLKHHHLPILKEAVDKEELYNNEIELEDSLWLVDAGYLIPGVEHFSLLPSRAAILVVRYLNGSILIEKDHIQGWRYFVEQVLEGRLGLTELIDNYSKSLQSECQRLINRK